MLETTSPVASGKKIGVLTFHRCINYGSYWQARCLVEGLRAAGHHAVILDHDSPAIRTAEWRVALRPTLPTPVAKADVPLYATKARKILAAIEQLPLSARFSIDRPGEMEPMDAVVVGSDEVWNLRHPWFGGRPAFFGQGLRAHTVIAYAASFGNFSCWEGIGRPWTDMLATFDAVSVRDENSWWMLKNAMGIEPTMALDPCLQFPLPSSVDVLGSEAPFVLVYGHNFGEAFTQKVRRWARRQGARLLSVGYRNDWADEQWIDAGPVDFARAVRGASAVATNFFHGCVFALLNDRPFACETSPYRSLKVRGLMELLGIENRLTSEGAPVDDLLERTADVRPQISALRQASQAYLDKALPVSLTC